MTAPVRYSIGDRVRLTPAGLECARWRSRQVATAGYPSDRFLAQLHHHVGEAGTVTHTFPPGYGFTLRFDSGPSFHMRDDWVEPCA